MYNKILNNLEYLKIMKSIDSAKFISDGKWDWEHGLGHATRVANYLVSILKQLGCDERTIEIGKVAALLHDIGEEDGNKINHAIKGSFKALKFLNLFEINDIEKKVIVESIADHSNGKDIKSFVGLALVLADKLDVTYHRTQNSSIQDNINKNIQRIKNVNIIINEFLTINYNVTNDFNPILLKEWDKCLTIPVNIAKYLDKQFIFKINNNEYDYKLILDPFSKNLK